MRQVLIFGCTIPKMLKTGNQLLLGFKQAHLNLHIWTASHLFTKARSFLFGANRVEGWNQISRAVSKILARCYRRFMYIHWVRILKTRVPGSTISP